MKQKQSPKKVEVINHISPASYDVSITDIAYEVMKRRSNAPFGSKNRRFINSKTDTFDVPYLAPESSSPKSYNPNPFNTSTRRFKYKTDKVDVGPGYYK